MNDACYVSSVDKIFGVVGPYVCKYNATTGQREGYVKVDAPLYGEMRICYHQANDTLYVATWHEPNEQYYAPLTWPQRDVFPVSTSLVVGAGLGLGTLYSTQPPYNGFRWIASSGSYLYIMHSGFGYTIHRIDPTNLADRDTSGGVCPAPFTMEHGALSPTQIVVPDAGSVGIDINYAALNWNISGDWSSPSINPWHVVACEYCAANGLFYAVDGSTNLIRIDNLVTGALTVLNPGAVEASADPCRIRYRTLNGKLYLPCMTANAIIVWNPTTDNPVDAESKTGFENPVDVIFTGSKAWAVQNSPIGLREIT